MVSPGFGFGMVRGMRHILRPVAAFVAILVAAGGLAMLIVPWQAALSHLAGDILGAATRADGFDADAFLTAIDEPGYVALQRRVLAAEVGFLVLVFGLLALRARAEPGFRQTADLVTAGVAAVLVGKLLFQVPGFDWRTLLGCCLAGGAAVCLAARTA